MLALISSIPTTVREGFNVQDLPHRASTLSEDTLENIFGGCRSGGQWCAADNQCCSTYCDWFNCRYLEGERP